eukprot:NODE_1525_length_1138_cov_68.494949_g1241_i0.p1 GENE.NODE_1525_length_1138_cov_68.494949_g1241_i0~~NODE_1525_length_1138_cov_68.494949_g1241_i0.p1  ORF type:complete len:198 (-),score=48.31 NODE_1525_length_1138_cov_68.494949_g1241_i0:91-684(-)
MATMALLEGGDVYSWGGQDACKMEKVNLPHKALQISCGMMHAVALLEDPTPITTPVPLPTMSRSLQPPPINLPPVSISSLDDPSSPMRPTLGVAIKMLDDGVGGVDNVVVIHEITIGGPAEHSELMPEDALLTWNGKKLDSKMAFATKVQSSHIGDTVMFEVLRNGKVLDIPVKIGGTAKKKTAPRVVDSSNVLNAR